MENAVRVIVYGQDTPLRSFLLTPGSRVVFGRGSTADVALRAESLSRKHLALSYEDGEVWATDLDSTNGSLSGGTALAPNEPTRVTPDFLDLSIGDFRIVLRPMRGASKLRETRAQLQELLAGRDISVRFCAGVGAHGSVWVGWQESLRRHVAIKVVVGEEHYPRFQREAMLYTKINDVSVVRCFDFSRSGPYAFMLMEYVRGVSLAEHMRNGPLKLDTALSVAEDLAAALVALQDQAVVHRDVKPSNVLLDVGGRAKLCDMGIGKDLEEVSEITLSGSGLGSLHYMAPEQMRDASTVGHEADLYALGATLYHMLAGEPPPLVNPQLYAIRDEVDTPCWLERNPQPLDMLRADCPHDVARLVEQLMRPDPHERVLSASVVREILHALRGEPESPEPIEAA